MTSEPTLLEASLRKSFPHLTEDAYIAAATLCTEANLSATELFCKWEAHAISSRHGTDPPTAEKLRALGKSIHAKSASRPKAEPRILHRPSPQAPRISVDDFFAYADAELGADDMHDRPDDSRKHRVKTEPETTTEPKQETPLISSAPLFAHSSGVALPGDEVQDTAFEKRAGVGRVEAVLNEDMKREREDERVALQISVHERYANVDGGIRYMNDDLAGRIEAVRSQVRELGDRVVARARMALVEGGELPPSRPEAFHTPSSDTVMAVGRVRVELDETDGAGVGRINEKSVVLESENGNLLKLNLMRLHGQKKQLFLHPGMVVAVEGVNTNGRILDVSDVHDNAIPVEDQVHVKKDDDMDEHIVHILAAGGPYTTNNNLRYEALEELCGVITRNKPDIVLLTGPFIDDMHPLVNESLPITFDKLFDDRILSRIDALARLDNAPHFILIPALSDAHHDFVAPQPALSTTRSLPSNVTLAPNPSVFRIQSKLASITIGLSSLPAIQDISADSLIWNKTDRFAAIASHMLRQASFYPTNPPAAAVPLDYTLLDRISMPVAPGTPGIDVLVLPSKLKAFAKIADADTVVVNPGILARGNVGGTYAEMSLPLRAKGVGVKRAKEAAKCYAGIVRI